ncbi:FAD-dependent monooxygenase [Arthrobacter crystallopoietes]|uniref:FAD-dependent monooxygenase n=1 Tax=Crystallibacter crystallopoietes TaxID=37928 RepID=UPI003D195F62
MASMPPWTEQSPRREHPEHRRTSCIVAGGGPAGIMLGLLLARAGVDVTVLEKHADFLRDFRGDTVHASTIRLLDELGLGEDFRRLPQSRRTRFGTARRAGCCVRRQTFDLAEARRTHTEGVFRAFRCLVVPASPACG